MVASEMAICYSQSDQFNSRSNRTMTGRCRGWMRTWQRGNMPVSLKTQAERTAKTPIPACRARVGGLCGFRGTAERVPAGSPKTGRCAAVRERWQKTSEQDEMAAGKAACGKCGKSLKMVKIEGFWTPRRESGEKAGQSRGVVRAPRRSHLPAVRAVSGIYEGVPNTAKNSRRALRNEKSPPFQGKQRGSNEKHEVNTEKW